MTSRNLASLLDQTTSKYPDRTAIVFADTRLTYSAVQAAANQVANLLTERGIGRGDRVALVCPNLPYFTTIYYGILKAGATVVPLNVLLKAREFAYHFTDADVKAVFVFEGSPELPMGAEALAAVRQLESPPEFFLIEASPGKPGAEAATPDSPVQTLSAALADQPTTFETVATDEDDTAVVLYTSGTTGQPKGAELRHRNMWDNALISEQLFGCREDAPDRYLCVLPLFHSFGQTVVQNGAVAYGGTIVMLPRFEAKAAIGAMLREQVSFFAGVPTMYWGLLGAIDDDTDMQALAGHLRIAVSGGSALPVEMHKDFERRFGIVIAEGYGLSETSPVATFKAYGAPARVGSIGTAIPGVELKLIEPASWAEIKWSPEAIGEIAIKGHNVFKGYYGRPDATSEVLTDDGWFRTGDLAKRDAEGWFYIVDRAKEMIIRGGFNVYPREIEEVLLQHPAISLAAVIGVPHQSHGEEIKAVVVLKPGASATPEEILEWGKAQFAAYKYPRLVEIVSALPMTATGKILKRELS